MGADVDGLLTALVENPDMAGWVVVVILFLLLNQVFAALMKLLLEWMDHRRGNGVVGAVGSVREAVERLDARLGDRPPYPQCHYAPDHFDQVEETHRWVGEIREMQLWQKDEINQSKFHCRLTKEHLRTIERVEDHLGKNL